MFTCLLEHSIQSAFSPTTLPINTAEYQKGRKTWRWGEALPVHWKETVVRKRRRQHEGFCVYVTVKNCIGPRLQPCFPLPSDCSLASWPCSMGLGFFHLHGLQLPSPHTFLVERAHRSQDTKTCFLILSIVCFLISGRFGGRVFLLLMLIPPICALIWQLFSEERLWTAFQKTAPSEWQPNIKSIK